MTLSYTTKFNAVQFGALGDAVGTWHTELNQTFADMEARIAGSYAGNPNGNVAGYWKGQQVFDTTNNLLYVCFTTGNAASAVWRRIPFFNSSGQLPSDVPVLFRNWDIFTSGGTWTKPTNFAGTYAFIAVIGGGEGGEGSSSVGSAGGTSAFGSHLSATGGGSPGTNLPGSGSIGSGTFLTQATYTGYKGTTGITRTSYHFGPGGGWSVPATNSIPELVGTNFAIGGVPTWSPAFLGIQEARGGYTDGLSYTGDPVGRGAGGRPASATLRSGSGAGVACGILDVSAISSASVSVGSAGSAGSGGTPSSGTAGIVIVGY